QSATAGEAQLGDKTPTYNFCNVGHMGEMEDPAIQDAVTPFVATGADPVVDGTTLRNVPGPLSEAEFSKGRQDEAARRVSRTAAAGASSVRARAAQAPERLTLAEAERAGWVEVLRTSKRITFIINTALQITDKGAGTMQVTPITGDGKRGEAKVYDLSG